MSVLYAMLFIARLYFVRLSEKSVIRSTPARTYLVRLIGVLLYCVRVSFKTKPSNPIILLTPTSLNKCKK